MLKFNRTKLLNSYFASRRQQDDMAAALGMVRSRTTHNSSPPPLFQREGRGELVQALGFVKKSLNPVLPNQALEQSLLYPKNAGVYLVKLLYEWLYELRINTNIRIKKTFRSVVIPAKAGIQRLRQLTSDAGSRLQAGMTELAREGAFELKLLAKRLSRKTSAFFDLAIWRAQNAYVSVVIPAKAGIQRQRRLLRNAGFRLKAGMTWLVRKTILLPYHRPRFATHKVKLQAEVVVYDGHVAVLNYEKASQWKTKVFRYTTGLRTLVTEAFRLPIQKTRKWARCQFNLKTAEIQHLISNISLFSAVFRQFLKTADDRIYLWYKIGLAALLELDNVLTHNLALIFFSLPKSGEGLRERLRKSLAAAAMASLILIPLSPALADIIEFTDQDINPDNPVLQQIADISANPEANLISEVQKAMEEIPPPLVINETPTSTPTTTPPDPPASLPPETSTTTLALTSTSTPTTSSASLDFPADSSSTVDSQDLTQNLIEIINTNSIQVTNQIKGESITGINEIIAGDSGENASIDTGDINIFANVLNVVNTNLVNSKIVEIAETFNSLSADLLLNHPETTPQEVTQDLVSQICASIQCRTLNSFTLTNQNNAEVENTVDVFGQSGQNLIQGIEKRATIRSGDVNALVNILNIVNTNLINSRWTIASINVFGDFTGDLILPSELYFDSFMSIGQATDNSDIALEQIDKIIIDIQNDNTADIQNNIIVDSDSGQNGIEATGTPAGKAGDLLNNEMQTGQSQGDATVRNFTNTNVLNGKWYLGIVNTLGNWSGDIYSLPQEVALGTTPTGLSFFATSAKDNDVVYQQFAETIASLSNRTTTTIDISNQNQAKIVNTVDLAAYSGENQIESAEVEDSGIFSGNTYALANILNFANTNLVNADLHIGLVNVFGKWNGNILFGFPDLAVEEQVVGGKYPKEKDRLVDFEISYKNTGGASVLGTAVEWHYDPSILSIYQAPANSALKTPGILEFSIGRVRPQGSGTLSFTGLTLADLPDDQEVQNYVSIFGVGPERNKTNNEIILFSRPTTTPPNLPLPPPPPSPPPANPPAGPPPPAETNPPAQGQNPPSNPPPATQPGGGGVLPPSQSSGNLSVLRIAKTNDSGGKAIRPNEAVNFTITVRNTGLDALYNVVVYDTVHDPSGKLIQNKHFPLGKMVPKEKVDILYEVIPSAAAGSGVYVNSAHAEALNFQLEPIRSDITAKSSFNVDNPKPIPLLELAAGQSPLLQRDKTDEQEAILEDPALKNPQQPTTTLETLPAEPPPPPVSLGKVSGSRTTEASSSNAAPEPLQKIADPVEAMTILIPELLYPQIPEKSFGQYSSRDKLFSITLVAGLIALGYALANLKNRVRIKREEN